MTDGRDFRTMTARILRVYRSANPDTVAAGIAWYDDAFTEAERIGARAGYSVTHSAVALAHLSPRTKWETNLMLLHMLLNGEQRPRWALTRQWDLAAASLVASDPLATFSKVARKTSNFAQAILGDRNAVVVDTWAARAAGAPELQIRNLAGYTAVADAYRRGARRVGLAARELQAVTWCHIRGRAA